LRARVGLYRDAVTLVRYVAMQDRYLDAIFPRSA
jgi:hypothetical protein